MAGPETAHFPLAGSLMMGLGLGGFVDGILFHQILQWHHMATSAGFPPTSLANLAFNTLLDGLFHAGTWVLTFAGLLLVWQGAQRGSWSLAPFLGALLMGFGIFNLVEGVVDHFLLGLHHVNETVPPAQWIYWDVGFLAWGAAMLAAGYPLYRRR
ncbi:DUF2243 domain-containing protein [Aestuariivirga sp.]|uniref:DUF2243 domain-containing protein n=1 Tax=Aestuariivirga sp. TaxID=2650926 RepID=UPI00391A770B